jgi:Radical SAM superfamily/Iron-sulfur cluster-binding domain
MANVDVAADRSAKARAGAAAAPGTWKAEPFLHVEPARIYNPLTDRALLPDADGYAELRALALGEAPLQGLVPAARQRLAEDGWLIEEAGDPGTRFLLKYVSLEAHTVCNQGCYFCPVSTHPRAPHFMSLEFYEEITRQLAEFRDTIVGVSMINYNEPSIDGSFVEQVAILRRYGLEPAVLSNGWGLTPARVDAIRELGGLAFLSINLSTLDRERYAADRRGDHLRVVMRNLDYLKDQRLAPAMEVAVLGRGDDVHRRDFAEIGAYFAGSQFAVKYYEVMNRAGNVAVGLRPAQLVGRLCGCEQTGSRPLQWVHITPHGQCVLCCQDYHEQYVVGDLREESLRDILAGPRMALMRRWVYGLEEAPADFLCRDCVYALTR